MKAHAKNLPGAFYVVDGCCTACDVPMVEAPGHFAYDSQNHCYVKRQPETPNEVGRFLRAACCAELECIRYRGNDAEVLRRLAEAGSPQLCDTPPPRDIQPAVRDHVSFEAREAMTPAQVAQAFQDWLRAKSNEFISYRFSRIIATDVAASFSYAWFEDNFHHVEIDHVCARWLA